MLVLAVFIRVCNEGASIAFCLEYMPGALTFLRSFVAGKANFCSQLLTSLVHFTVVKSQAILIIRLGVAEIISAVTLYLLPASK